LLAARDARKKIDMKAVDSRKFDCLRSVVAAVIVLGLLWPQTALAVPMRCSGEQTTCIANCKKNPDRSFLSVCVTNCGARQSICMKTGCWDSGVQKYCGLLKQ
jgi:hypothetical protein